MTITNEASWKDHRILRYKGDGVRDGDSGAPIFKTVPGEKQLLGVHVFTNNVGEFKAGTLLTQNKIDWIIGLCKPAIDGGWGIDKGWGIRNGVIVRKRKRTALKAGIDVFKDEPRIKRRRKVISPYKQVVTTYEQVVKLWTTWRAKQEIINENEKTLMALTHSNYIAMQKFERKNHQSDEQRKHIDKRFGDYIRFLTKCDLI